MRNRIKIMFGTTAMMFLSTSCNQDQNISPVTENGDNHSNAPAKYIVVFKKDVSFYEGVKTSTRNNVEALALQNGVSPTSVDEIYDSVLDGFSARLTTEQAAKLKADPRVEYVEEDKLISIVEPVELDYKSDHILSQTLPWGVGAVGGSVNASSQTGVAWIVDTGIDLTHADLNVLASLGKTFVTTGQDAKSPNDLNGHGSHVAGIIAAKNNSYGTVGVCAGAQVIPVKVLDSKGSGYISQIVLGLDYVRTHLVAGRLNVVNLSLGGGISPTLDNAVANLANAGAYVVVAAGNSFANSNNSSPARVNGIRIFTISAYGSNGVFASFSNYGNPPIDYSAPGVSIYSTYKNGGYATMSGTSMATPHVAGILLANNGIINYNGYVTADPDGTPDPKARR